jgi:2-polyprenyl-3-methyl-5-hydroxy-6-metoxy-1,4-benzoquinol methylase
VTQNWHAEQDEAMNRSLDVVEAGSNDPSPTFRMWVWAGYELLYQTHMANLVALERSDERFRLLDLGCGTGAFLRKVAESFPNAELVGIDASRASLELARQSPVPANVTFVEGMFENARALGRFDVVVLSEVYEHVEASDELLRTAFDVLEPGGHLSFSTPSGWMWRRPGFMSAWHLVNSPATPRLRDRPTPGAVAERARNVWGFYRRIRLRPEENWRDALPYHPGVRPSVARRALERAGFEIELRASSLWLMDDQHGTTYKIFRRFEKRSPVAAARRFLYGLTLLESLLNLVPPLRLFESRVVLLARKPRLRGTQ